VCVYIYTLSSSHPAAAVPVYSSSSSPSVYNILSLFPFLLARGSLSPPRVRFGGNCLPSPHKFERSAVWHGNNDYRTVRALRGVLVVVVGGGGGSK